MREHVRPFTAGAGRHSRTHCARKSSIESQATGSESRGEIVTGGAAVWGSGEIQSEKKDGSGRESHGPSGDDGRVFVMYHGTSWRKWQKIRRHGFLPSGDASGLGAGVYLTRNEQKAEFYKGSESGVIIKVRVRLGKMIVINRQGHPLQKCWQRYGYDSAFAPAGAIGRREENCVLDPTRIVVLGLSQGYRPACRYGADCACIDSGCGFDHGGLSESEDGGQSGNSRHRHSNARRNKRKSPSAKRQSRPAER